jgi:hypothetical protein
MEGWHHHDRGPKRPSKPPTSSLAITRQSWRIVLLVSSQDILLQVAPPVIAREYIVDACGAQTEPMHVCIFITTTARAEQPRQLDFVAARLWFHETSWFTKWSSRFGAVCLVIVANRVEQQHEKKSIVVVVPIKIALLFSPPTRYSSLVNSRPAEMEL